MAFLRNSFVFRNFRKGTGYKLIQDDGTHSGASKSATANPTKPLIWKIVKGTVIALGKFIFGLIFMVGIILIFCRQILAIVCIGSLSDTYRPLPINNTIPVANPSTIALAKVSAVFSFFDWIPLVFFACLGKSRSQIIILGICLSIALTFVTNITAVPPIAATWKAHKNRYGYLWDSRNSIFYRVNTGIGKTYLVYSFALAAHVIILGIIVVIALIKLVIPSTIRLPKRYKPLINKPRHGQEVELEKEPNEDGYLAQVFAMQEKHQKLMDREAVYVDTHTDEKLKVKHNPNPKFVLRRVGSDDMLQWESPRSCKVCENTSSAVQTQDDEQGGTVTKWPIVVLVDEGLDLFYGELGTVTFELLFQLGRLAYTLSGDANISKYYWNRWLMILLLMYPFASIPLCVLLISLRRRKISPDAQWQWRITYIDIMSSYGTLSTALTLFGNCMTSVLIFKTSESFTNDVWLMVLWICFGFICTLIHIFVFFTCLARVRWIPWSHIGRLLVWALWPFRHPVRGIVRGSRWVGKMFFHFINCCILEREDRDLHRSRMTIEMVYKQVKGTKVGEKETSTISLPKLIVGLWRDGIMPNLGVGGQIKQD